MFASTPEAHLKSPVSIDVYFLLPMLINTNVKFAGSEELGLTRDEALPSKFSFI